MLLASHGNSYNKHGTLLVIYVCQRHYQPHSNFQGGWLQKTYAFHTMRNLTQRKFTSVGRLRASEINAEVFSSDSDILQATVLMNWLTFESYEVLRGALQTVPSDL